MKRRIVFSMCVAGFSLLSLAAEPVPAEKGCDAFAWNVTRELAVMREPAEPVQSRADAAISGVKLAIGRHYLVRLHPQSEVGFAVPPARPARDAAPHGGSLSFIVEAAGRYRISITSRHWIDVVADGKLIDSADHQGRAGCELMHKVVEFELPAKIPLAVQLSGQAEREVGLAITPAPAGG